MGPHLFVIMGILWGQYWVGVAFGFGGDVSFMIMRACVDCPESPRANGNSWWLGGCATLDGKRAARQQVNAKRWKWSYEVAL